MVSSSCSGATRCRLNVARFPVWRCDRQHEFALSESAKRSNPVDEGRPAGPRDFRSPDEPRRLVLPIRRKVRKKASVRERGRSRSGSRLWGCGGEASGGKRPDDLHWRNASVAFGHGNSRRRMASGGSRLEDQMKGPAQTLPSLWASAARGVIVPSALCRRGGRHAVFRLYGRRCATRAGRRRVGAPVSARMSALAWQTSARHGYPHIIA
jgi:hypothetical protein